MNRPEGLRPDPASIPRCNRCQTQHTPASWEGLPAMQAPALAADGIELLTCGWVQWRTCRCGSGLSCDLQTYAERLASARAVLRHATERLRAHASGCSCGCGAQDEALADELERLAS